MAVSVSITILCIEKLHFCRWKQICGYGAMVARGTPNAEVSGSSPDIRRLFSFLRFFSTTKPSFAQSFAHSESGFLLLQSHHLPKALLIRKVTSRQRRIKPATPTLPTFTLSLVQHLFLAVESLQLPSAHFFTACRFAHAPAVSQP